jgi:hypothetical protein
LFYEKNFSAFAAYFLENYGIVCKEPAGFSDLNKYNVVLFIRMIPDKAGVFLFGPILQSDDKECLFAYPCVNFYSGSPEDGQMFAEIKASIGLWYTYGHPLNNDTAKFDIYDYASAIVGKKTREMFNADTLYIYDIPHGDSVFFVDEEMELLRANNYPYCTGLVIYKEGGAATLMKLFLSEKGKSREDEYIKMLTKRIWYDDNFNNETSPFHDLFPLL